ncbi:extracellular catalytic domain type 1 short-chain-length polyhydroxyalkanoate depolymerase [Micromonospora inyonensis]|uniref:Polyhydroxybutyrate depolymerase n=1 Tax=Micromonospora inyonensis TaxID=47866 RepID=A0A1C6S7T4_9ACTN|nr:PHB depolymerase family esterase [Micromonospora inyonensis]SCL25537.1 polyhydroxybutyrate depolymerase [Micromonospora inyonensis]
MNRRTTRTATVTRTASAVVVAVGVVLTVLIGCDVTRPPRREAAVPTAPPGSTPTAAGPRSPVAGGSSAHRITVAGRERTFRLYRPAKLSPSAPAPLVVMLHGALGNGRQAEMAYGWNAAAEREGFVVAYPDGLQRSWAVSAHCCGQPAHDGVDDVAFVVATVADISARLSIDPNRTYAAGISNGGMLAYRLACETTTFAAIGVVAGTLLGPCPSPAPISLVHIHGTADDVVPYDGRPGKLDNGGAGRRPVKIDGGPVADQVDRWRKVARCAAPQARTAGAVTTSAARCPDGRDVELITIADAGHQWPGASPAMVERLLGMDPPSSALAATETIWRFFAAHPRNS